MNYVLDVLYIIGLICIGEFFRRKIFLPFKYIETKEFFIRFGFYYALCFMLAYAKDNFMIINEVGLYLFLENWEFQFVQWLIDSLRPLVYGVLYSIIREFKLSWFDRSANKQPTNKKEVVIDILEYDEEGNERVICTYKDYIWW